MAKPSRRDVLAALGLAVGGNALAGCERREDPYRLQKPAVPMAKGWHVGKESWVPTACGQCPAGCGIKVRVVEGRAVKIEGNDTCAINRGGIGPRATCGTQVVYDPDRLRQPMRRTGPRGAPTFEPVSWDDALADLGTRLGTLRAEGKSHLLGIVAGRERGMMLDLFRRFGQVYGTPNVFDGAAGGGGAVAAALHAMQGIREVPAYDWAQTRYILSLGSGLLGSACQMMWFSKSQSPTTTWRGSSRARIVHLEPYRSQTAVNADEWISVRPGTYAAFALGVCHVLVRDGRYDQAFVAEHCFGFEAWTDEAGVTHRGLREVLDTYTPERVAEVCGIEAAVVERISEELASTRPSFAIAGGNGTLGSNGLYTAMAVHALNALLGSIERPGGVLVQRDAALLPWPAAEPDAVAVAGLARGRLDGAGGARFPWAQSVVDALPPALLATDEPLQALMLYYANPLYSRADPARWRRALEKVPFIVSFSPFLDETSAEMADLILPDDTYLERWEDAAPTPSIGLPVFGVRRPVIERLYDTRNTGDVVLALAKAVEGMGDAFPWPDFKGAVLSRVGGPDLADVRQVLVKNGYWSAESHDFERWEEVFKTPSGKLELYSQALAAEITRQAGAASKDVAEVAASLESEADLDTLCLPHHAELRWQGDAEEYPLKLYPFRYNTYSEGSGANLPWLQEMRVSSDQEPWTTPAVLHPETAAALGVGPRDRIGLVSPAGRVEVPVRLNASLQRDVVAVPQGGGHTAFGRYAQGWGANVMQLVAAEALDPVCGAAPLVGTRVRIEKVTT